MTIRRQQLAGIDCRIAEPDSQSPAATLVLMHGIGGDDSSFDHQLKDLSADYRVVAWNMPGYRGSEVQAPLSFERLAQSLHNLLDALDVVLIATTSAFGGRDNRFRDEFLAARLQPLEQGMSMQALAQQSIPAICSDQMHSADMQIAIEAMSALPEAVYRDVLSCLVTFNRRSEFAAIACPLCVIAGTADSNAPAATMAKMAASVAHAQYHELTGGGHLLNTEMPDQCNRIISHFINGIESHAS